MINDRNVFSLAFGYGTNEPSINKSMGSVPNFIDSYTSVPIDSSTSPIPATSNKINFDLAKETTDNEGGDVHTPIIPQKGVIYYSDGRLDTKILEACQKQLRKAFDGEIVNCSLSKTGFGDKEIVLDMERGYEAYFTQILTALENSDSDIIFFCEHDVLYPPEHFDFVPTEGKFYYDLNWWKVREDGLAVHWDAAQVSGLVCYKELALKYYRERLKAFDPDNFDRKFEPTVGIEFETWKAEFPSIDIRHEQNLTYNKWHLQHFRDKSTAVNFVESTVDKIPGWPSLSL
jgi:hypothetical protein